MRKASGVRARFQFGNVLRGRCSCGSGLTARGLAKAFALRPIAPAGERLKISAFAGTLAQIWGVRMRLGRWSSIPLGCFSGKRPKAVCSSTLRNETPPPLFGRATLQFSKNL